jgi:hypothetical protein
VTKGLAWSGGGQEKPQMNKGKLLSKTALMVAIIAGTAAACGVAGYVVAQWPLIDAPLKPAIISGAFTILAAMGGALVVFWQLRKQAENTIKANRHNEMMKLKKEVYVEIISTCMTAMAANRALHEFIVRFRSELWTHKYLEGRDVRFPLPSARSLKWFDLRATADEKTRAILPLIDRWKIIDPRIDVVSLAIEVSLYDATRAQDAMAPEAIIHMPSDPLPEADWTVPNNETFNAIQKVLNNVEDALDVVANYISDFQREMQNALLGELFDRMLPPRIPKSGQVVELEKHIALTEYFTTRTTRANEAPKLLSTRDPPPSAARRQDAER